MIPVRWSPRPVRAAVVASRPFAEQAALRLLTAFAVSALVAYALVAGLDSLVLVLFIVLVVVGAVKVRTERAVGGAA